MSLLFLGAIFGLNNYAHAVDSFEVEQIGIDENINCFIALCTNIGLQAQIAPVQAIISPVSSGVFNSVEIEQIGKQFNIDCAFAICVNIGTQTQVAPVTAIANTAIVLSANIFDDVSNSAEVEQIGKQFNIDCTVALCANVGTQVQLTPIAAIANTAYVVTFGAEPAEYDKNIQDVEKMINSINLDRDALENVQANQADEPT